MIVCLFVYMFTAHGVGYKDKQTWWADLHRFSAYRPHAWSELIPRIDCRFLASTLVYVRQIPRVCVPPPVVLSRFPTSRDDASGTEPHTSWWTSRPVYPRPRLNRAAGKQKDAQNSHSNLPHKLVPVQPVQFKSSTMGPLSRALAPRCILVLWPNKLVYVM